MGRFERGLAIVIALYGALMLLGYAGGENDKHPHEPSNP
jgi:hypothetical protein